MFDIKKVIEDYNIDITKLATVLYPLAKYKKQAFDRVLRGESFLDVNQLYKLAEYLSINVSDLFKDKNTVVFSDTKILYGELSAVFDVSKKMIFFYNGNELIEKSITDTKFVTIDELIEKFNTLKTTNHGH